MKIEIRKANLNDCEQADNLLTKLILDEKQYDSSIDENFKVESYYKNFIEKEGTCLLLAVIEGNIVGYIYGFIIYNEPSKVLNAKLDALYVEKEFRHQGIAGLLINSFLTWAEDYNINNIEVNVCSANKNAINLYKKFGFSPFKITMNMTNKNS